MNIIQKSLISLVKLYQKILSPDHSFWAKNNPPYCKHYPTCEYSDVIPGVRDELIWWKKTN